MDKQTPRISVVMPVYNGEEYLIPAIDSILNQTFADFEILIIDDGSTDGTREVLETYQKRDSRILVYHQSHLGLVAALNKGIELARGKYIARMDADDVSAPTRLAEQAAFLESHPEVGVLGTQMRIIDQNNTNLGNYEVPISHSLIVWTLLFGRAFAHPTIMIRRELLQLAGGYRGDLSAVEDLDLWLRLVGKTRFSNLDRPLVTYRTHPKATSVKHSKIQQMNVRIARHRFISDLLGKPIPVEQVEWLAKSQKVDSTLDEEQVGQAVSLLSELYEAFEAKEIALQEEKDAVRADYIRRTIRAGQSGRNSQDRRPARKRSTVSSFRSTIKGFMKKARNLALGHRKKPVVPHNEQESFPQGTAEKEGITIIILSYTRKRGLHDLLRSLLLQELGGIPVEIIMINNHDKTDLRKLLYTRLGHALQEKFDVKVFDSSHNWHDSVRYSIAMLAKHETILHLDDDIVLLDRQFISYMYNEFKKLRRIDILSCWTTLWTRYTEDHLYLVGLTFNNPDLVEVTECDVCGTGICMYSREILLNSRVFDIATARNYPNAYDMAFSIIAWMELGSRGYFLPSFGKLEFHSERIKNSIHDLPGHHDARFRLFKSLYKEGYVPVMSRSPVHAKETDTPEWRAAQHLEPKCRSW